MNVYKTDLHTNTVLSPCDDIEMAPSFIVKATKERGMDIVGITVLLIGIPAFEEIKMALHRKNGRLTKICYE